MKAKTTTQTDDATERAKAKAEEEALQRASEEDFEAMQANGVAAAAPRDEATKEDSVKNKSKSAKKAAKARGAKPGKVRGVDWDAAAQKKAKKGGKPKVKEAREDLLVFAFRLTKAERDAVHRAAGPGKASRFVRNLVNAASRGDERAVTEITRAGKETAA